MPWAGSVITPSFLQGINEALSLGTAAENSIKWHESGFVKVIYIVERICDVVGPVHDLGLTLRLSLPFPSLERAKSKSLSSL
jgi:hypothetical protein